MSTVPKKPSKIHELLAVDTSLKGQAQKLLGDLKTTTFEKKKHLFGGKLVTYVPLADGVENETREQSTVQTTVPEEIKWLSTTLAKAIDVAYAIDIANTQAKADIVLDDDAETVLAKDVPTTALLQLGHRVKEIQELILAIPTLDPAKGFERKKDEDKPFIYRARDVVRPSTKKVQSPLVLYPSTKEHPAQVQLVTEDVRVGTLREQEWSGLITPAIKADLMERVENVGRAISAARSRANAAEIYVDNHKIGKKLLDHIFQPLA